MKHAIIASTDAERALDMPCILERIAATSARPRYTMLVLDLIVRAAGAKGRAGP